jgi:hypothetical protein
MPVNTPGLDFQTVGLAAGLVGGLTFLIGQARSYLDGAISDARDLVRKEEEGLQSARLNKAAFVSGKFALDRYAQAPGLIRLAAPAVRGLLRRPVPAPDQPGRARNLFLSGRGQRPASELLEQSTQEDIKENIIQEERRYSPTGIAISFLILLVAVIFAAALVVILITLLISVGWGRLSAHPSTTGSTLILIAAFAGVLAVIAWLTARDAIFDLIALSDSESMQLARWSKQAEHAWQTFNVIHEIAPSSLAAKKFEEDATKACEQALEIYSRAAQALHIRGLLAAGQAAEDKKLLKGIGTYEIDDLLHEGTASLRQLPGHLVPVPTVPDPRLTLAWLSHEANDDGVSIDMLATFLLCGGKHDPAFPGPIAPDLWWKGFDKAQKTSPELLSEDAFNICDVYCRPDSKSWVKLASSSVKQGIVARSVVLAEATELSRERPNDEDIRTLISLLKSAPDRSREAGPGIDSLLHVK